MTDAVAVMFVGDTIDKPMNTKQIMATNHMYSEHAREK